MWRKPAWIVIAGGILAGGIAAADEGSLAGRVVDEQGRLVVGAMVLVCDQKSGFPVDAESFQPITEKNLQTMAAEYSDERGEFSLAKVKPGEYRLLAQSWEDAKKPVRGPIEVNGATVRMHGLFERVKVPSDEAAQIVFRPLGTATLDVTTDPKAPNNETLLIISRAPLAADPILAFSAWSGEFIPQMIAANRMPLGRTTFHGMPEGVVHLAAFAADNNAGFGGATATLAAAQTSIASVPMIASWSNGHKKPPERLQALVGQVQKMEAMAVKKLIAEQHPDVAKAIESREGGIAKQMAVLAPFLDREIALPSGQRVPLKDLAAASGYANLLRAADELAEGRKRERLKQLGVDPAVGYEQALADLHATLGKGYPCFQLKGIDWEAVGGRLLPRARQVATDAEFGMLCLEMVAALEDSHAQLLPAAVAVPEIPFPTWDAGFACLVDDRDQPVVYYVADGSAAAAAGVKIGMTIVTVNGEPADKAIAQTAERLSRYVGYSSARCRRYDAYRLFVRQLEQGSQVTLETLDVDGGKQSLRVQASHRGGYLPRLPIPIEGVSDSANVGWKMLEGGIGYIYVRRIQAKLNESLDAAVKDLKDSRGLVIDVRGNSGGGFDAASAHRNFNADDLIEPDRPRFAGPIAVLVDARCISAGEGWTSWFVGRPNVRLFGETTAGASSRKTSYTLKNGLFKVSYPVKAYTGFLDRPIERRGIEPDVPVMQTAADLVAGKDTVLEAAKSNLAERGAAPAASK